MDKQIQRLEIWLPKSSCVSVLLALIYPSGNHYRMTYIPFWAKRKITFSWYISTVTPLLTPSIVTYSTLWVCTHFQSQSVVIRPKISSKHSQLQDISVQAFPVVLFEGKMRDVTWSLAIRPSKGRGQSSCRHLQLSGSLEWPKAVNTNAWHSIEEISAFHQEGGCSWMACDKSYYWVISDFQELVAMVQADCMHSLFTSHFLLFISDKKWYFQGK